MVKESLSFFVTKSIMCSICFSAAGLTPGRDPPGYYGLPPALEAVVWVRSPPRHWAWTRASPLQQSGQPGQFAYSLLKSLIFKTFSHPAYLHHINDNQSTLDAWLWGWLWSPSTPGYVQWRPPSPRAPSSPWWPAPDARHAALPWPRAPAPRPPGPRARLPSPRR